VFVWCGSGTFAGAPVQGGAPGMDELVLARDAAVREHQVENTGTEDLVVFSFFGPDLHTEVPTIQVRG
jgi:hypothetical protein